MVEGASLGEDIIGEDSSHKTGTGFKPSVFPRRVQETRILQDFSNDGLIEKKDVVEA